ncbi:MAG: 4'-phosphopantetheinyl transferase superfamily protein [Calditrichaeota bacterium]|nr:MAG: phosphopantetheine-protein transferase [Calditrichota bacterium]MBL1204449.1 4'-phosphopantetheinyl transferase superfamily protein [Calditrichota bacterium]NOG44278.1 4'-phosphopantetheinyl transferase superfamily protein [Calditrichota bacterium]
METTYWREANDQAYVLNNNVHIWLIRYDQSESILAESGIILSKEEKERASRFHFEIDHRRYSVTRSLLKKILGKILSKPALKIKFTFNKYGKPELVQQSEKIFFNVSHSGNLGLIAISDIAQIGVDVEKYREEMITGDIAKRFFSDLEVTEFLSLNENEKLQGFFNCWTRKEAFIKAVGKGLSIPLNTFDVSLIPGSQTELRDVRYKNETADGWHLSDIKVDSGYAAAFIIKAKTFSVNYWYTC